MKRIFAVIISLCMCFAGFAMAEETFQAVELIVGGESVGLDVNGDGTPETVAVDLSRDDEIYMETATLTVDGEAVWSCDWCYVASAYAADLNGDGIPEIFITGDEASDDYITYCLNCTAEGWVTIPFADASRGENTDEYMDYGYGMVADMESGVVTLCGSQDVLGTYFGSRQFTLTDGRFEFADDGLWQFPRDFDDPNLWENYSVLTAAAEIPATFTEDGAENAGVIAAGEKLVITASDKLSVAYFTMEDGRTGYLSIAPNTESWGSLVNGVPEGEVFEFVPYAD